MRHLGGLQFIVATIGPLVNGASLWMVRGARDSSLNMKGAYLEVLRDMLGSLAVITAAVIIRFTGWSPIDPIWSALIGLWVLPRTWNLLGHSVNILLEGVPEGFEIQKLHNALMAISGALEFHDLHVWSLTRGPNSMTLHLVTEGTERLLPERSGSRANTRGTRAHPGGRPCFSVERNGRSSSQPRMNLHGTSPLDAGQCFPRPTG